jgi:uncharacterized protein YuzE
MSTAESLYFDRVDYDREVDVLYLTHGDPHDAVDFDETWDGHGLRFDADGELIGVTVVGARRQVEWGEDVRVEGRTVVSVDALADFTR